MDALFDTKTLSSFLFHFMLFSQLQQWPFMGVAINGKAGKISYAEEPGKLHSSLDTLKSCLESPRICSCVRRLLFRLHILRLLVRKDILILKNLENPSKPI